MAEIKYSCGHGSYYERLTGNRATKDNRKAWLERHMLCRDCYRDKKREEEAVADKIAKIHLATKEGAVIAQITLHGQTYANKDAIKALGYRWTTGISLGLEFLTGGDRYNVGVCFMNVLRKWTLTSGLKTRDDDSNRLVTHTYQEPGSLKEDH